MDSEAEFLEYQIGYFEDRQPAVLTNQSHSENSNQPQNSEDYFEKKKYILSELNQWIDLNPITEGGYRKIVLDILSSKFNQDDILQLVKEASGRYFQTEQYGISQIQKNAPDIIVMAIIIRKFCFLLIFCEGLIEQLMQKFAQQSRENKKKQNVRVSWKMLYLNIDKTLLIQLTETSFNHNTFCCQITLIRKLINKLQKTSKKQLSVNDQIRLIEAQTHLQILTLNIIIKNKQQDITTLGLIKNEANSILLDTKERANVYAKKVQNNISDDILRFQYIKAQAINLTSYHLEYDLNEENLQKLANLFEELENENQKKVLRHVMKEFLKNMQRLRKSNDKLLRKKIKNIKNNSQCFEWKRDQISEITKFEIKQDSNLPSCQNFECQQEQQSNHQFSDLNNYFEGKKTKDIQIWQSGEGEVNFQELNPELISEVFHGSMSMYDEQEQNKKQITKNDDYEPQRIKKTQSSGFRE